MERVAISADNLFGLFEFLLESGVVGRELVGAVGAFDEEQTVAFAGVETGDGFFGKNDAKRIADLAKFEFDQGLLSL